MRQRIADWMVWLISALVLVGAALVALLQSRAG
jgi:hypothetical protein